MTLRSHRLSSRVRLAALDPTTTNPEEWSPASFQAVLPAGVRIAVRRRMAAFIDEAARLGALDAGTADYADAWLDAQLAGWRSALEEQATARRKMGGRLVAMAEARLAQRHGLLEARTDQHRRAVAQRDAMQHELGGAAVEATPAALDLPRAALLRGHALAAATPQPALTPVRPIRPTTDEPDADSAAAAAN